jgi:hypothetical protein
MNYDKHLSKQEIQAAWDYALLSGAKHKVKWWRVIEDFMLAIGGDKSEGHDFYSKENLAVFNSMGLKRCRDRQKEDDLRFEPYGTDPLSFIGARCLPLQLALLDNRIDLDDIVKNVRVYKWVRKNWAIKKGKSQKASYRIICARSLSHRTNWSTVK